ncbi:MAG: hypothetical protein ACRDPK_04265 [Carbonactinosporaceae bacterium]
MTARRLALGSAGLGVVLFGLGGVWAMVSPRAFFEQIATYPPYNHHLLHDVGAFQLGIAAALAAGVAARPGLVVGLWGGAVGASAHAVSHWLDADLGGRSSDAPSLTAVAVIVVAGLIAAERAAGTTALTVPREGSQRSR